jgi:hypothetical protein
MALSAPLPALGWRKPSGNRMPESAERKAGRALSSPKMDRYFLAVMPRRRKKTSAF